MFRLSYLQACEPEALSKNDAVIVEVDDDLDGMGFNRVDVVAATREDIVDYVRENWGDEDEVWFAEVVVGGIVEAPISFDEYKAVAL